MQKESYMYNVECIPDLMIFIKKEKIESKDNYMIVKLIKLGIHLTVHLLWILQLCLRCNYTYVEWVTYSCKQVKSLYSW